MQFFYEPPHYDVKSITFDPIIVPQYKEHLVRDESVSKSEDEKAHLTRAKRFFEKTLQSLDLVGGQIDQIKKLGIDYAATRNRGDVTKALAAVEIARTILDNSIYSHALFPSPESDLYNIWIFAGRHIDQQMRFPLGTWRDGDESGEKISIAGLKLDTIDITMPSSVWLGICKEADSIISREKAKIKTYLRRIDLFMLYADIQIKYGYENYTVKAPFLLQDPYIHQKNFIESTVKYLDIQLLLLKEIQKLARESLAAGDTKDDFPIVFHIEQMADEIDRLASQASFNGMTLLQGYWAGAGTENAWSREFIFNTGVDTIKKESLLITTMISFSLLADAFDGQDWQLDIGKVIASKVDCAQAVTKLDAAIKRIEGQKAALMQVLKKIPAKNPFSGKLLSTSVQAMKEKLRKEFALGSTGSFTPKPGLKVNTNAALFLIILDNAYATLTDMLSNVKTLLLAANRLFYTDAEYRQFLSRATTWLAKMKELAGGFQFNAKKYFDAHESVSEKSFLIVLDERGKWSANLSVYPLTAAGLGLDQMKEIFTPFFLGNINDYANRHLAEIDVTLRSLLHSRSRIQFVLASVFLCEKKDLLLDDFAKKKNIPGASPEAPAAEAVAGFFELERLVVTQLEFYAWAAVNTFYTDADRMLINEHISLLIRDGEMLASECYALIEQSELDARPGAPEKQKITDLKNRAKDLWTNISRLKDENDKYPAVGSEAGAEKLYLLIGEIKKQFFN